MMWPLTWLNRSLVTINVIFQLLDIYIKDLSIKKEEDIYRQIQIGFSIKKKKTTYDAPETPFFGQNY